MAPPEQTGVVLEFFCQEGDTCWNRPADELVVAAARDLETMGLLEPGCVSDSVVLRLRKAYPVYNLGYDEHMRILTDYMAGFENLANIGRNATFRYTSSDHYIDMGLKAAENVLGHAHDLDAIGRESGYAETWKKGER
jgi:protoporphyrinogen oxidase